MASVWYKVRCVNKLIRHLYNTYTAFSLKFEFFWVDWLRMTSFYVLYVAEYILGVLLVLATLPYVKSADSLHKSMPNPMNINFDYSLIYFFFLCTSLPNFLSTFIYLHKKRAQQLYYARGRGQLKN